MHSLLSDPRLADCRRIFLHEFSLDLSIGFHDFEREAPQRVIIDVDLFVPKAHSTAVNDVVAEELLGPLADGRSPQRIVPAGVWQAAEPLGEYSLTGACVGPGFEFTDFRMLADEPGAKAALAGARPEKVSLMLSWDPDARLREVPDPYYGEGDGFVRMYEMLVPACRGLLDAMNAGHR